MKDNRDVFCELVKIRESGEPGALCLVTRVQGSAPQITGAKMLVKADGSLVGTVGGGAFEHRIVKAALEMLEKGAVEPVTLSFQLGPDLGMCCGGAMEAYIEPLDVSRRLVIFGGGHVGKAVGVLGHMIGFRVTVVDDREEWANRERFPDAAEVVNLEFDEYLDTVQFGENDHLVIMTRGHEHDQAILERVIGGNQGWLGMIGSRRKVARALERMRAKGVSEEVLSRVEAPVGLQLGAVSPEEIAVSVAARLVQLLRIGRDADGAHNMAVRLEKVVPEEGGCATEATAG